MAGLARPFIPAALLLALGVLGLIFGAGLVERRLAVGQGAAPAAIRASSLVFRDAAGRSRGELRIAYPTSLRENEDGFLRAEYEVIGQQWGGGQAPSALAIHAFATGFEFNPSPARHAFDLGKGVDGTSWIVSPRKEGDYNILVRMEASGMRPDAASINGARLTSRGDIELPLRVTTRYRVPQSAVDMAKAAVALISFLLTLPAAAMLFRRVFKPASAPKRRARG